MSSLFNDDDIWNDDLGDDFEASFVDCAVLECKNKGAAYLCIEHMSYYLDRQSKYLVCWNCNSLVKLLPQNYAEEKNEFPYKKFIFCKRCRNCGDITDEKKIVLDERKKVL